MLPLRPWEMEQLTPDEEARLHAHHRGPAQDTHTSLTEAVERGW